MSALATLAIGVLVGIVIGGVLASVAMLAYVAWNLLK